MSRDLLLLSRRALIGGAAALFAAPAVGCTRGGAPPIETFVLRRGGDRGAKELDWLSARYTFSFSKYRDPMYTSFRSLRVMNEDRIQPRGGFPMHPHEDMEIVTYVLDGALEHRDSMGNGAVIEHGIVQQMSAGTGVRHSEFNPLSSASTHLYQIWFLPNSRGAQPSYAEAAFPEESRDGALRLIASGDGAEGSIRVNQDIRLYASRVRRRQTARLEQIPGRGTWIQVCRGEIELNGERLVAGDGAHSEAAGAIAIKATEDAEVLVFDLA